MNDCVLSSILPHRKRRHVSSIGHANRKTDTTLPDGIQRYGLVCQSRGVAWFSKTAFSPFIHKLLTDLEMKPERGRSCFNFSVRVLLMTIVLRVHAMAQKRRCGGILREAHSSISSPKYPHKYPARLDCSWTILAPPGHKIILDFRDFRLQDSDPCRDWLDIYDGSSIRETKVGRYCGSVKPLPVTSSGHNLHIRFKTDSVTEDRGFRARYNTTLVCGGTFSRYPGTITSPNYPNDYFYKTNCLYKIVVPKGFKVKVKFQDFVLEAANQDGVCYDYVEAFDGSTTRNRSLGIFCGSLQSFTIFSSGQVLLLRMTSDKSRNNKGFKLLYTAIDIPRNPQSPTTAFTPDASTHQNSPRVSLPTVTSTSCPVDQFRCNNGRCIERRWLCDRQDDCGDSSDEQSCPCHSYQLTCANGACVDKIWSCDGSDDCGDGTDELDCNKPTISSVTINCSVNKGGCHHNCTEFIARGRKMSECVCLPGYRLLRDGKSCVDIDECKLNNGGCQQVCLNIPGSHVCACNRGYFLTPNKISCEDINECSISNGGCNHDCINELGSYHCRCYPGFKFAPDKKKCRDINECKVRSGGCSQSCVNSAGSYYCQCLTGFKLDSDEKTCSDINECAINNGGCQHECMNTLGSYLCTCDEGYIEDFEDFSRCMDIDECAEGMPACFDCKNTPGSYECGCDYPGFVPNNDKTMCMDIDECSTNNGGCGKHKCTNNYGSYRCQCLPGYKLDFTTYRCEDIDECATNNHAGPCDQTCTNTPGSYACSCRDGYKLRQQKKCLDIDECAVNAHQCEHYCNNTVGSYTCSCRKGFFLSIDGFSCSKRKDSRVCGSAPLARPPTEGGWQAAESGAWPWAALLHLKFFGDVEGCMGTLIDKEWVLTAAHCVSLGSVVLSPSFVKVELGAFTRASASHKPVLIDVAEIVLHKEFEPNPKNLTSNIALIRLAVAVNITDEIKPICIPTRQEVTHLLKPGASRRGVLIGWGKTSEQKVRKTLQQAQVEIVHRSKCAWPGIKYEVINMICAGFTNAAGTPCISDTGSPLMFAVGRNPSARKWVLGGITSWGLSIFVNGCHRNFRYTGYTSVERYLKWIKFRGKNSKGNTK